MTQAPYITRGCPNCGLDRVGDVCVRTTPSAEELPFDRLKQKWVGLFHKKTIFSYTRCASCGLLYAPVFFSEKQLDQLYESMPPNMDVVPLHALRRTQRGYFDFLRGYLPASTGTYVEFGADVGLFTENCLKEGSFDEYLLIEPNEAVTPQLSSLMSGKRFRVLRNFSDIAEVADESVTVCVMIHVLDHLLRPFEMLERMKKKMKPDSVFLVVTHDEKSLMARLMGSKWPAYCLQHPQLYNTKTIDSSFRRAGFEVVKQAKTCNYFPVSFLLKNLLWSIGITVGELPAALNRAVGLKLGNIVTLARPLN